MTEQVHRRLKVEEARATCARERMTSIKRRMPCGAAIVEHLLGESLNSIMGMG